MGASPCTSASVMAKLTSNCSPSKPASSIPRSALCAPSAPTSQSVSTSSTPPSAAVSTAVGRGSRGFLTSVSRTPRSIFPPSSVSRSSRSRSVSLWAMATAKGYGVSVSRFIHAVPSRRPLEKYATPSMRWPFAARRSVISVRRMSSRSLGHTIVAREWAECSRAASTSRTGMCCWSSSQASSMPTGPAPTITTCSFMDPPFGERENAATGKRQGRGERPPGPVARRLF